MYQKLLSRSYQIDQAITQIDNQLKSYPKGNFYVVNNNPYYKWYYNDGIKTSLISQKDSHIAEGLATQKYLTLKRQELQQEKSAIHSYLNKYCPTHLKSEEMLLHPEYARLLRSHFKPTDQLQKEWVTAQYEKNKLFPEQLTHKTPSGIYVRSKSEVLIDMALYTNQIPFRYECALKLDHIVLYPDFTILHPKTNIIYYWEHFGLINQSDYQKKTFSKLELYSSHGIIPSINLITTFETPEHPLTLEMIEHNIQHYFL